MKKFYFLLICFCLCNILAYNQTVVTGEYFIDKDPGLGKGFPITLVAADIVKSVSVPVSVSGLPIGYHSIYTRVKDSYGHWGNYRQQRFYVFNNDSLPPNKDSVYLVQAEYFIDTIPTPGKGKLIDLPHVDSISYSDSIPGLTLDSGVHLVGVRVKDNKGAWSFIKSDSVRTEYQNLEISVTSPPFIKQGEKTKYTITIKNTGSTDLFDLFLVVRPTKQTNPNFGESIDTINGLNVSNVNAITELDSSQYIPIWIYTIPSRKEKAIDLYMETTQAGPHEILPQQFEIYYDFVEQSKPLFRITGDTSDFISSRLFSILHKTVYYEQPFQSSFNAPDSVILTSLDAGFKAIDGLFIKPILVNKIIKPVLYTAFNSSMPDSLYNAFSVDCFSFLRQSFSSSDDAAQDTTESNFNILDSKTEKCTPCELKCDLQPQYPLVPFDKFQITSYPCISRCFCECNKETNTEFNHQEEAHGGIDISLIDQKSPDYKTWSKNQWDVIAIYDGTVIYADTQCVRDKKGNCIGKDLSKGLGYFVAVKSECNGTTFNTLYGHLNPDNKAVKVGDKVTAGTTVIGWAGSTGNSFHTHLHLEITKNGVTCNPNDFFSAFKYLPKDEGANTPEICKNPKSDDCKTEHFGPCNQPHYPVPHSCPLIPEAKTCNRPEHLTPDGPNDKTGNKGYGIPQYITKEEQLHYGILFENKDSASAPAQVVTIKDTLDKNKIDVNSLKIESVTAGEMLVVLPDSVHIQTLDTIYTKKTINGTYVHVQTTFDTSTGVLEFRMTSLDTLTLQPVTDPLQGFLPPDTTNFDGNGLVSFKVMPKQGIKDGTVIYNTAHIIFDKNPAIATGTWLNTIDSKAPSSYVKALPEITYDTSFKVSWQGADSGAGIIYYDIYFKKKNDIAYIKWLTATSDTSAVFTGQLDSTYKFYSIAYDSLLNIEVAPDTADATTTISSSALPVTLISFNANCLQKTVSLEWITANESGIKYFTIEKSINGINWVSAEQSVNAKNNGLQNQYKISDTYNGYLFYRLRITSDDGNNTFSSLLKINCGKIVNSMQAYPVPTKNLLNVIVQTDKAAGLTIILTDLYGRRIKKVNENIQEGVNNFSLDISNIANGQYILKAEGIPGLKTQKIIIVH